MCGCYASHWLGLAIVIFFSSIPSLVFLLLHPSFPDVVNYTTCIRSAGWFSGEVVRECIKGKISFSIAKYIFLIAAACVLLALGLILAVFRILNSGEHDELLYPACMFVNAGLAVFTDMIFVSSSASLASHAQKGESASCTDAPSAYSFGSKSYVQYCGFFIGWVFTFFVCLFIPWFHELSAKIVLCCLGAIATFVGTFVLSSRDISKGILCGANSGAQYDTASYVMAFWDMVVFALMFWHCFYDFELDDDTPCGCCRKSTYSDRPTSTTIERPASTRKAGTGGKIEQIETLGVYNLETGEYMRIIRAKTRSY